METSTALAYECLIRTAHQCGKFGVKGADADLYNKLEAVDELLRKEIEHIRKSKRWNMKIVYLTFEHQQISSEVATHIIIAIENVLSTYDEILTYQYKEKLVANKMKLNNAGIVQIRHTILQFHDIMKLINLDTY